MKRFWYNVETNTLGECVFFLFNLFRKRAWFQQKTKNIEWYTWQETKYIAEERLSVVVRKLIRRFVFGYKADENSYITHLKEKGAQIGNDVKIFSPAQTMIDMQAPYLLKIGSNVVMTGPVTILTHDYSAIVCAKLHPNDERAIAAMRPVSIGDNVFIGWGATILPGTSIGSNTIIGAGAVVKGNIEADSVYAGNPAQRISSIESFYNRRISLQVEEAYNIYTIYVDRHGKEPDESDFYGYESLWKPEKYCNCKWNSFEEFCRYVRNRISKHNYT